MIREGDWKLIHFAYYGSGLLYNPQEDLAEFINRYNDPSCHSIRDHLLSCLRSEVDPLKVCDQAFRAQDQRRHECLGFLSEDEMVTSLAARLGVGQARVIAHRLKLYDYA